MSKDYKSGADIHSLETSTNRTDSSWPKWRSDMIVGLGIFLCGLCVSMWLSSHWPIVLNDTGKKPFNVWFYADANIVYENMTSSGSDHYRTNRHPLFSLLTLPVVTDLVFLGLPPWLAVRLLVAAAAGSLLALAYAVLRLLMTPRFDAALGSALLASTSSFAFWAGVPETFIFGGTTIVATLAFAAYQNHRETPIRGFVYITSLAMSVTITNVSVALAMLWCQRRSQAFRIAANALLLLLGLWVLQKWLYPSAGFFFGNKDVLDYVLMEGVGTPWERVRNMIIHSAVMPDVSLYFNPWNRNWPLLSIEHAAINVGRAVRFVAIAGWVAFLASGLVAMAIFASAGSFGKVLLLSLVFQALLHVFFGDEVFLYSLHWIPMLVIVAIMALRLSGWFGLRLALLAVVGANFWINYRAFLAAVGLASP